MQHGAFGLALCNQLADTAELDRIDNGTHVGRFVERITHPQLGKPRLEPVGKDRLDAFLDQYARTRAADLSLIEPDRIDNAFDGAVDVGIGEDDEGRLAAKFQRQLLAGARSRFADGAADFVEPVKAILSTSRRPAPRPSRRRR
jgi:hypothetical protein